MELSLLIDSPYMPIFIGILGLIVGSFINVVIYRLPKILKQQDNNAIAEYLGNEIRHERAFNLAMPSSHCPECDRPLKIIDNIPLLSFIFLRGKCRYCESSISWQYPLVELLSAAIALTSFYYFGLTVEFAYVLIYGWVLLSLACIDIKHKLLPDILTLSLLWIGLLVNSHHLFVDLYSAVYGAASGYLIFFTVYWIFKLLTHKDGLGYGDFKLLAALGAWCGWQSLLFIILISSVLGVVISLIVLVVRGQSASPLIPYGLYLSIAGWAYLLWGEELIIWYTLATAVY